MTRSRGGDSSKKPSPSELLKEIGIAGPVIVKILKGRGWQVCEGKSILDQHERYYFPGCRVKGQQAKQGEDYLVGVGELYAFVLEKDLGQPLASTTVQRRSSSREKATPREAVNLTVVARDEATARRSALFESGEDTDVAEYVSEESSSSISLHEQKKRRKKLKNLKQTHPATQPNHQASGNVVVVDDSRDVGSPPPRGHLTNENQEPPEPSTRSGLRTELEQYESALKVRGATSQLLKNVDLSLLCSVAEIAFRHATLELSSEGQQNHPELERFAERIQAARNCLCLSIAGIVDESTSWSDSSSTETGIKIPSFISTDLGRLVLLQDTERYVLLVCQALRSFTSCAYGGALCSSGRRSRNEIAALRPLQYHINAASRELLELVLRIRGTDKKRFANSR